VNKVVCETPRSHVNHVYVARGVSRLHVKKD